MYNYRASECESPGNASFKIPIFIADGSPLVGLPNLARVTSPCRVSGWILGARKAGTSSLYTYLARHPGVHATKLRGAPGDGELRYKFAAGADAADLAAGYNAILGEDVNEKGMIFDSSVGRLVRDPAGLVTACGSVNGRFAVVLREPVARCYSQMMMRVRLGSNGMSVRSNLTRIVERDLDEFLRTTKGGTDWMEGGKPSLLFNSSKNCIYEGVYAAHLKRWLFYVAREQIHVLFNEDLERAGMAEFKQLLRFFNLDESVYDYSEIGKRYNAAPVVAEERDNLRFSALLVERMSRVFAPYNLALTQLFNLHPPWSF